MSLDPPGRIRVFVQWTDQAVFAGEEIKCRITFKNVAPDASPCNGHRTTSRAAPISTTDRARQVSPLHPPIAAARAKQSSGRTTSVRGHRSILSLNVPRVPPKSPLRNGPISWSPESNASDRSSRKGRHGSHNRSVSIVSIASAATMDGPSCLANGSLAKPQRPARGHGRSSSLQIFSRGSRMAGGPHTGTWQF